MTAKATEPNYITSNMKEISGNNQSEIILYQSSENQTTLEVRFEAETVWLTQAQMVELFDSTKQNISLHINNIFKEGELAKDSVVKYSLTTATDGKTYNTASFNLDVIISVGYRVKSQRGTQFRIWANQVLKEYLLKGHVIHQRFEKIENDVHLLKKKADEFDFHIKTSLPPHEGIFYEGQIFDAHKFVSDIIKSAKKSIILIDNYIDESVLALFSKRKNNVSATIYTASISKQFQLDLKRFNAQYPKVEVKIFAKSHDRFLIIDNETIYHIGASLKDLGKKWFAFSKIELNVEEMIAKLEK
jgi:hypothetical protein